MNQKEWKKEKERELREANPNFCWIVTFTKTGWFAVGYPWWFAAIKGLW